MGNWAEPQWDSFSGAMENAGAAKGRAADAQWYALQLRLQFEKKAEWGLRKKGIETFLPLVKQTHRWSDRSKVVEIPLFAGYVFIRLSLTPPLRIQVLQTAGVVGFVGSKQKPVAVPEKQIEGLRRLLKADVECALRPFLRAGQRVRIRSGALDGLEGILQEDDRSSLVITIECIHRSLAVKVRGYDLELV